MALRRTTQQNLVQQKFDPIEVFTSSLIVKQPWDNIIDFATHPDFCGKRLYPRQQTLLKLIFLETENMTPFDIDVIEEWRQGFKRRKEPRGVQPDIWDRVAYLKELGYPHFPHVQAVMGRRASKGMIGGIIGAWMLAWMYSLDDWQDYYGVAPGKDGYLMTLATNMTQASRFQFADIRETVESCKYLQPHISTTKNYYISIRTPADVRRIAMMKANKIPIEREIASLRCLAMSSNSASGRGATAFANFFDEFAHMISGTGGARSSEEVYEAYQPSLDQFGKDSFTYVPSSPYTQVGKFYELYKHGSVLLDVYNERENKVEKKLVTEEDLGIDAEEELERAYADPEMLVVQVPSWELYRDWERGRELVGRSFKRAIQYDPDDPRPEGLRMKRLEKRNPDKFKVERRAQFAAVLDAYLDPDMVERMLEPVPWRSPSVLEAQSHGRFDRRYRVHFDPGKSNANFAIAIGHTEEAPPDDLGDVWPHVIIDFLYVWRPQDYEENKFIIPYTKVMKEISDLISRFPSAFKVTADQWNSAGMLATIKEEWAGKGIRVSEQTFTASYNTIRAERFKSALNLGWVHAYKDTFYDGDEGTLLELELKFLQEKNGKIHKQDFGPVPTKDLADCVMVVTSELLKEDLDRWSKKNFSRVSTGSTDVAGLRSGREVERVGALLGPQGAPRGEAGGARQKLAEQQIDRMRARMGAGRGAGGGRLRGR